MTSPPPAAAVGNATLATACSTRGCQLENAQRRIAELEQRAHDLAQSNVQFEATANDALTRAEAAEADLAATKERLAQADAVIDAKFMAFSGKPKPGSINGAHLTEALARHTTRQSTKAREEGR